ncbi:MAG: HDOD domain-containing protein [Pseudomonadota bacterium]
MQAATVDYRKQSPARRVVLLAGSAERARRLAALLSFDTEFATRIDAVTNIAAVHAVVFAPDNVDGTCASAAQRLRQANPQCLRILIYVDPISLTARACDFMHQVLSRERAIDELDQRLQRCFQLRDLFARAGHTDDLTGLEALPSLPAVYNEFIRVSNSEVIDFADIAAVIQNDLALTARIVGLANSAAFAVGAPITTIERAVGQLGLCMVSALVTATCLFSTLTDAREAEQLESVWAHSDKVAKLAIELADAEGFDDEADRAEIMQAGLLHDIGQVVVMTQLPDVYRQLQQRSSADFGERLEIERRELGATHADIGACLLAYWGISARSIDAVACHHNPGAAAASDDIVATSVLAANTLLATDGALDSGATLTDTAVAYALAGDFGAERVTRWCALVEAFVQR